jgi:hypothetical protein
MNRTRATVWTAFALLALGALAGCRTAAVPPPPAGCLASCHTSRARCDDACLAEQGEEREVCGAACATAFEVCSGGCEE